MQGLFRQDSGQLDLKNRNCYGIVDFRFGIYDWKDKEKQMDTLPKSKNIFLKAIAINWKHGKYFIYTISLSFG